jgi:hypothetical protein
MSWPTTRKHPRSLAEAYPDIRATWHEGWQRNHERWLGRLLAVAIGIVLALSVVHWIDWSLT